MSQERSTPATYTLRVAVAGRSSHHTVSDVVEHSIEKDGVGFIWKSDGGVIRIPDCRSPIVTDEVSELRKRVAELESALIGERRVVDKMRGEMRTLRLDQSFVRPRRWWRR